MRTRATSTTRTTAVALAAATAGAVGGAVAVSAASAAPAAAPAASTTAGHAAVPDVRDSRPGALLRHVEHGRLTLQTRRGTEVVDVQRGTVTAVGPSSVSVRSADGTSATYALTSSSRLRVGAQRQAPATALRVGHRALVVAQHETSGPGAVLRLAEQG